MREFNDKELELSIASMLRFGVTLSALLVSLGGILYLRDPWQRAPLYGHFVVESRPLRAVESTVLGSLHLDAKSILEPGMLLLIATPIFRGTSCIIGLARQGDSLYVLTRASVFAILI